MQHIWQPAFELAVLLAREAQLFPDHREGHTSHVYIDWQVFTHNVTHNAGSHRSQDSPTSRASWPQVVFCKLGTHYILYLARLAKDYEFHLYYDI
ncbi:MAG TPA: hypothetical protein VGL99_26895 [Chloroflexota bacterium]